MNRRGGGSNKRGLGYGNGSDREQRQNSNRGRGQDCSSRGRGRGGVNRGRGDQHFHGSRGGVNRGRGDQHFHGSRGGGNRGRSDQHFHGGRGVKGRDDGGRDHYAANGRKHTNDREQAQNIYSVNNDYFMHNKEIEEPSFNDEQVDIPSLPAYYKFSWDAFIEPSYVDNIGESTKKEITKTQARTILETLQTVLTDDKATCSNNVVVKEGQYTVQELIDKDSVVRSGSTSMSSYKDLMKHLSGIAQDITKEKSVTHSLKEQDKTRQHKLLVLALLRHAVVSKATYKESGSNLSQAMYKRVYLVGDSRVHDLYARELWENTDKIRPNLISRDDLSLYSLIDFIQETIPLISVKGKILVVCSVGIMDVVRSIDEQGVLLTLEKTLTDMKQIRKQFQDIYGAGHDLLFADILPADITKLVAVYEKSVTLTNEEETKEKANVTTIKLIKLAYLLSKNMMVEELSGKKHLPPWEIFVNPPALEVNDSIVSVSSLKDGFNPSVNNFSGISTRITKIFKEYYTLKDPPSYNNAIGEMYFVCNEKYSAIEKFWPKLAMHEKPTFIFLESVNTTTIASHLENKITLPPDSALVIWFDITELFSTVELDDCKSHMSLKLEVPRFHAPQQIFDELTIIRKDLQCKFRTRNVIITTLCPIDYPQLIKNSFASHKILNHDLDPPSDIILERINTYLLDVVSKVNLYIVQSNRVRGLPAWDICSYLYKRDQDGKLLFQPPVSPSEPGLVKPPTVAKIMMSLSELSKITIDSLNWIYYRNNYTTLDSLPTRNPATEKNIQFDGGNDQKDFDGRLTRKKSPPRFSHEHLPGVVRDQGHSARFSRDHERSSEFSRGRERSPRFSRGRERSPRFPRGREPSPVFSRGRDRSPGFSRVSEHSHYRTDREMSNQMPQSNELHRTRRFIDNEETPPTVANYSRGPVLYSKTPATPTVDRTGAAAAQYAATHWHQPLIAAPPMLRPPLRPPPAVHPIHSAMSRLSQSNEEKRIVEEKRKAEQALSDRKRKRICFGIKSKEEEKHLESLQAVGSDHEQEEVGGGSAASAHDGLSIASLEKIVTHLRSAHEAEVGALRKHPDNHAKYAHHHAEFIEQAVTNCRENREKPEMASIQRVWEVYWKMQLEKSFVKTWDKRVAHLTEMLTKDRELPLDIKFALAKMTKLETAFEALPPKFSASETNLLNRFKKMKGLGGPSNVLAKEPTDRSSGVMLGEKLLSQVQKGWKSLGCKKSQGMLDNAISKITDFMSKPGISVSEKVQYISLGVKLKNLKEFLISKEGNPYDLDYKSIAEITQNFNEGELAEYVAGVIENKMIDDPATDDLIVICKAIRSKQKVATFPAFVSGGITH